MRKRYAYVVLVFLLYLLYRIYMANGLRMENTSQYIALVYGTMDFSSDSQFIWNAILWIFPQIPLIVVYSDYFEKSLQRNYCLLVWRHSSKFRLVVRNTVDLMKKSGFFIIIQLFLTLFIGMLCNVPIWKLDISVFLESMNMILYFQFVIVTTNLFSLFTNNMLVVLGIIVVEWLQLFLIKTDVNWIKYLPIQGGISGFRLSNIGYQSGIMAFGTGLAWFLFCFAMGVFFFCKKKDFL